MRREIGILYADVDIERVGVARRSLDVVGCRDMSKEAFETEGREHDFHDALDVARRLPTGCRKKVWPTRPSIWIARARPRC